MLAVSVSVRSRGGIEEATIYRGKSRKRTLVCTRPPATSSSNRTCKSMKSGNDRIQNIPPSKGSRRPYLAHKYATKEVLSAGCSNNGRGDSSSGGAATACDLCTQIHL